MQSNPLCCVAPSQWQSYRGVDARVSTLAPVVAGPMHLRPARAGSGNPFE